MEERLKLSTKTNDKEVNESIYRKLVGSLIYLITTRANLSFPMSCIPKFMIVPKVEHWITMKQVPRYVKGTLDFGFLYSRRKDPRLCGYIDSDCVGSVDDGYIDSDCVGSIDDGKSTF
jgi:hypothetical protein